MQWSEYCVNAWGKADCLRVLQTTFMEPGQPRPPKLTCYTETVDRNCIQHEYQQQVILMSNVNPIFGSPSGCVVWGEGPGCLVPEITSLNPTLRSPENDSAGITCLQTAQCAHTEFLLCNFPGSQLPSRLYSKLCFAHTPRPSVCLHIPYILESNPHPF